MNNPRPVFHGVDIGERLWILLLENEEPVPAHAGLPDGTIIDGHLFVQPEDGSVVFRQTKEST